MYVHSDALMYFLGVTLNSYVFRYMPKPSYLCLCIRMLSMLLLSYVLQYMPMFSYVFLYIYICYDAVLRVPMHVVVVICTLCLLISKPISLSGRLSS